MPQHCPPLPGLKYTPEGDAHVGDGAALVRNDNEVVVGYGRVD